MVRFRRLAEKPVGVWMNRNLTDISEHVEKPEQKCSGFFISKLN